MVGQDDDADAAVFPQEEEQKELVLERYCIISLFWQQDFPRALPLEYQLHAGAPQLKSCDSFRGLRTVASSTGRQDLPKPGRFTVLLQGLWQATWLGFIKSV